MNPVIAPISKNNNVEQQLDSPEFPTIGKNATQFSNSPSRIHIEPQKIHINTDLDDRKSSIVCIKETKFMHTNNRNRINEIERERQNQPISQTNKTTNINKSLFYKKIKAPNFDEKPRLSEQSHKPDIDVILYQLITKGRLLQNAQKHNNSISACKTDCEIIDNVRCKTSYHKVDVQNATFEFDDIYGSFCPQGQNVSKVNNLGELGNVNQISIDEHSATAVNFAQQELFRTPKKWQNIIFKWENTNESFGPQIQNISDINNLNNIESSKQISFNRRNITEVNFEQQGFIDTTKKEENTVFKRDNFNWNFGATLSQNVSDTDNLNNTCNDRKVAIDRYDTSGINFEQKASFGTNGKVQEHHLPIHFDNKTTSDENANKCIDDDNANASVHIVDNIKNPITKAILDEIYKPSSFISLLEAESHTNDEAHLELCIGSLLSNTNAENINSRTKQIRLDVPKSHIVESKQTLALEIKLGHCDRQVALRLFDRPENIASSTIGGDIYLSIVLGVPSNVRHIVLNVPESTQSEIEVQDVSLQVIKNTAREVMFDLSNSKSLQDKKITNREVLTSLNDNKNAKSEIKNNEMSSNKKIIDKEDFLSLNNYESPKLGAKNNNAFSDENIAKDFISLKNDESLKLDIKNNEALPNEKIIDKENFALPNNYENSKFGIKNDMSFSNEEVVNKGDFILSDNSKNTKLSVKNYNGSFNEKVINEENLLSPNNCEGPKFDININGNEGFINEKIDNKKDFVLSNNYENSEFDIKNNLAFSNKEVSHKEDFVSHNNYKNLKLDISDNKSPLNEQVANKENFPSLNNYESQKLADKNNEGFFNEKRTNKGDPISLDNYGNTKFDIRISGTFSNEKMINNEYSLPPNNDDENKKLVIKCSKVFLNGEIDNKEHSVASNNAEVVEDKGHESSQSAGIFGKVTGFFSQIIGMCRRKK